MKFLKKKQIDTAEVQQDIFTGNGILTEFTLTFTVMHEKQLFVTVNGLTQEPGLGGNAGDYTINNSGTKVVFTQAPANGATILCKYIEASPISVTTIGSNTIGVDELNLSEGETGQALTTNGAGTIQFSSVKSPFIEYKNTNFTVLAGQSVQIDTTNNVVTMTLPANPSQNDAVQVVDAGGNFQTYNLTVARNGSTIMGVADDMIVDYNIASFGLVYNGSTWRVFQ